MGTAPSLSIPAAVEVADDQITIHELVITDEATAGLLHRGLTKGRPPEVTFTRIVQVGARAIEQAGDGLRIAHMQAGFTDAATQVATQFTNATTTAATTLTGELTRFLDPTSGELQRMLTAHATDLQQAVMRTFDQTSTTGIPHQLTEQVRAAVEATQHKLLTQLAADSPTNPLTGLQQTLTRLVAEQAHRQDTAARQLVEGITAIRESLAELRGATDAEAVSRELQAEQLARSTNRGFVFEDHVTAILAPITHGAGDLGEDISTTTGAGRSKKGDYQAHINAQTAPAEASVVFEMKTEQLSLRRALDTLDAAMQARQADAAVLVVPNPETLPKGAAQFMEAGANKLLVALNGDAELDHQILTVAYRVARARALLARATETRMDADAVRDATDAAKTTLKAMSTITTSLTTAGKSIDHAKTALTDTTTALLTHLGRIEAGLNAVTAPPR